MKSVHLVSEMFLLRFVLGILIFTAVVFTSSDDKDPPSIVLDLKQHQYFKQGESISLQCRAKGSPNLTYEWRTHQTVIHENASHVKLANGYLNITSANGSDEGYYRCFPKNDYGTAMTDALYLQYAMIKVNGPVQPTRHQCQQGKKCSIVVDSSSQPPAVITSDARHTWFKGNDTLKLSKRVQVDDDPNGPTLYFAYVKPEDSTYENPYNVSAYVDYLDISVIIASYYLNVTSDNTENTDDKFAPEPAAIGQPTVFAAVGSSAKMRCFFYGNPEPNITWSFKGEQVNQKISNFDTELEITNVSYTDEGRYICHGSNERGDKYRTINLVVGEAPTFVNERDHPYDATVKVGENLTFHCNAQAREDPAIKWFKDGKLLDVKRPLARFEFSGDRKRLTIVNICSKCHDRETDMMVIQCSVENRYGRVLRNGYVKVVDAQSPSTGTSTSQSTGTSQSQSPQPISKSNKAEFTGWLILLALGLKSLLLAQ